MPRLKLTSMYGGEYEITLRTNHYANNNNLYIGLDCWEDGFPMPYTDLTVNLYPKCEPNCAFIDINNNGVEIINWLMANKLGKLTGRMCHSGFCQYPEFEFNMEEVQKYVE